MTGGGTIDLSQASQIDGASFLVSGGVTLALPAATSYAHAGLGERPDVHVPGRRCGVRPGFVRRDADHGRRRFGTRTLSIEAYTGGQIDLRGVTRIADSPTGDRRYGSMSVTADGPGSLVRLDALTLFQDVDGSELSRLDRAPRRRNPCPATGECPGDWADAGRQRRDAGGPVDEFHQRPVDRAGGGLRLRQVGQAWWGPPCPWTACTCRRAAVTDLTRARIVLTGGGTIDLSHASQIDGAQFPGQRRRHAGAAFGHELHARGRGERPDVHLPRRRRGVRPGLVRRDANHRRHVLELGPVHRGLHGRPDRSAARSRGSPTATAGDRRYGSMSVAADGTGSLVRLDALTEFQDLDGTELSRVDGHSWRRGPHSPVDVPCGSVADARWHGPDPGEPNRQLHQRRAAVCGVPTRRSPACRPFEFQGGGARRARAGRRRDESQLRHGRIDRGWHDRSGRSIPDQRGQFARFRRRHVCLCPRPPCTRTLHRPMVQTHTLRASGQGSRLELPAVTTIANGRYLRFGCRHRSLCRRRGGLSGGHANHGSGHWLTRPSAMSE